MRDVLDIAVRNGFTVMRAWAHGVTGQYATMPKPGEYDEGLLRGLDYALAEAGKRGIKVPDVFCYFVKGYCLFCHMLIHYLVHDINVLNQ